MKENIFEELSKMKNLIYAKAGTVISEQANLGPDVGAIMQQLNKFNTDETAIVNIIKKYNTKDAFQNFLNQYKSISGKDFGVDLIRAIKIGDDNKEINDIRNHLSKFGIGFKLERNGWSFPGVSANSPSYEELRNREESWKTTNSCVPSKIGARAVKLSDGTTAYQIDQVFYYSNGRKKLADGTMTNYDCKTEFKNKPQQKVNGLKNKNVPTVGGRFTKSAQSLGIQNGKMDVQTLQTVLKTLEGGESTASTTQGTPDLAKLTSALNQLNANA